MCFFFQEIGAGNQQLFIFSYFYLINIDFFQKNRRPKPETFLFFSYFYLINIVFFKIWVTFYIRCRTTKNALRQCRTHARTRSVPKKRVLGAAAGANSLNKTWFFESPPRRPGCLKNQNCDDRTHARTRADPKRRVLGAAAGANSLNKTWFRINLMWVQEWLKNQNCDDRTHARCQKEGSWERPPERIP